MKSLLAYDQPGSLDWPYTNSLGHIQTTDAVAAVSQDVPAEGDAIQLTGATLKTPTPAGIRGW